MIGSPLTPGVLEEVHQERILQDNKWGEQNHGPFRWLAILGEEVGEANKAILDGIDFETGIIQGKSLADYRAELIQVAAVAVSMVECLDRHKWEKVKKE